MGGGPPNLAPCPVRCSAYAPAQQNKRAGNILMKKIILAALALAPMLAVAAHADTPTAREIAPKMPQPPAAFAWAYPIGPQGLKNPAPDTVFTATGADP